MEHGSIPKGSIITSTGCPNLMIEKAKQSRCLPVLSVSHHLELKISLQEKTLSVYADTQGYFCGFGRQ